MPISKKARNMKRSEIEKELIELKNTQRYMKSHNTGRGEYRGEVATKIEIYEKLIKEGYDDKS